MIRLTAATAIAAVLGLSTPAFAQSEVIVGDPVAGHSDSLIDQIGGGNSATVEQTASNGAGNSSTINQAGEDRAKVIQGGGALTLNKSQIDQSGGNKPGPDQGAFVTQNGDGTANTSMITQGGPLGDNLAQVTQGGGNNQNTSTVTQGAGDNSATINQGLLGFDSFNESTVTQNGTYGVVTIDQTGTGGTENESFITQFDGEANQAIVNQGGLGLFNFSTIGQSGDGNFASVTQQ